MRVVKIPTCIHCDRTIYKPGNGQWVHMKNGLPYCYAPNGDKREAAPR
jgi:hypothetical protein